MSSTTDIQKKYDDLKTKGVNLGNKKGAEVVIGYGGVVQSYDNGNIYWHHKVGTYEVHGGILSKYLSLNSVGHAPHIDKRLLGFPTSDEMVLHTDGNNYPVSYFEWGAIYWIHGGVAVSGHVYEFYKNSTDLKKQLGYPVSDNHFFPFGEVVYFENGCLWAIDGITTPFVMIFNKLPQIGNPLLVNSDTAEELTKHSLLSFQMSSIQRTIIKDNFSEEQLFLILNQIWDSKIALQIVHGSAIKLQFKFEYETSRVVSGKPILPAGQKLQTRRLYNLLFTIPGRDLLIISPHCLYARKGWDNFGLIHATDIHVSRRLDSFRRKLHEGGFAEGVQRFNNWNDAFRDFIRYANKLYAKGLLDGIAMTGDLIDYIFEIEDNREGGGNFQFFIDLIMGKSPYLDKDIYPPNANKVAEELRVPVFTILGNHDYRLNRYELVASLDVDNLAIGYKRLDNYSPLNLSREEALYLQGLDIVQFNLPRVSSKERVPPFGIIKVINSNVFKADNLAAARMVSVNNNINTFYKRKINSLDSYVVRMGINKLVMLDTKCDEGISNDSLDYLVRFVGDKIGFNSLSESELNFLDTNPDTKGLDTFELDLVKLALSQTNNGSVIIGMHAPPINPNGNEYPHYFRETEHPTIDRKLVNDYIHRNGVVGDHGQLNQSFPDWIRTGSPHFKQKNPGEMLDYGISKANQEEFLKLCTGINTARKANLVLSGHGHKRVDYRLDKSNGNFLRFYMDFYSENPTTYYLSKYNDKVEKKTYQGIPNCNVVTATKKVHPTIKAGSQINGGLTRITDHRANGWKEYYTINIPPYANPLNNNNNPASWWAAHSPIIMQTAGLGPTESNDRIGESTGKPELPDGYKKDFPMVSFQGFRFIQIENNVISKIRYVTLKELRERDFVMPWEPFSPSGPGGPVINTPGGGVILGGG